jgi:hypothetical protein
MPISEALSMPKNIPLSVRVTEADAEFLAGIDAEGAATPSDKVRALLADARRRQNGFRDYGGCLAMANEMIAPTLALLKELEKRSGIHSEPVAQLAEWLPETLAFFLTTFPDDGPGNDLEQLEELEQGVTDRIFRLTQAMLRLAITPKCEAFDPAIVSKRVGPTLEIAEAIRRTTATPREEKS